MNCKHCGYPVNRGQRVCPSCGKPVRRGHKALRTLLVIVLILAAAVVGFLHYRDIGNFFVRRGMDAGEYYRHVELQNYKTLSGLLSKAGEKGTSLALGHERNSISLRADDAAQQLLAAVNTGAVSLDWVRTLGLSLETNMQNGLYAALLTLSLNDTDLVSLDGAIDQEDGKIALRVPELSENVLLTSLEELGLGGGEGPGLAALMEALGRAPSGDTLLAIFERYLTEALAQIETVEMESGTLAAGGLERDCTVLTVRLTDRELADLLRGLCESLRGDEEVLGIVENVAEPLEQEGGAGKSAFLKSLDETIARLAAFETQNRSYTMQVFVDAGGRIAGRQLRCETADGELIFTRALVVRGGRFGLELRLEQGEDRVALTGGGKLQGLTLSGEFQAESNGTPMLNLTFDAALKGLVKGDFRLTLRPERALLRAMKLDEAAESLAKDLALQLYASNLESPTQITLALLHDNDRLLTAEFDHRALAAETIDFPETGLKLSDWTSGIKLPGLFGNGSFGVILENLQQAGVPTELIVGAKLLLPQLFK